MPFAFGDEPSNVGEVASVNCVVQKGDLPLEIHWILNSGPIVSGEDGFTIVKMNARTSYLNIDYLDAKHRGLYKCIAKNMAGVTEHVAELHVNGLLIVESKQRYYIERVVFLAVSVLYFFLIYLLDLYLP